MILSVGMNVFLWVAVLSHEELEPEIPRSSGELSPLLDKSIVSPRLYKLPVRSSIITTRIMLGVRLEILSLCQLITPSFQSNRVKVYSLPELKVQYTSFVFRTMKGDYFLSQVLHPQTLLAEVTFCAWTIFFSIRNDYLFFIKNTSKSVGNSAFLNRRVKI